VGKKGGEDGVDQQRDLRHRHPQQGRRHQLEHATHARVCEADGEARQHADAVQEGQLQQELQHAAEAHRPGQCLHRRIEPGRGEQRHGDERQVEQHRRERRSAKRLQAFSTPAATRHQGNEQDVGEGDARQFHREGELVRLRGEARRRDVDQ